MLKNLSIKVTVFSFIIITALLLGISCIMAILLFENTSREALYAKQHQQEAAVCANNMKIATIQVWQFLTDVSATGERDGYQDAEENARAFKKSLSELKKIDPASTSKLDSLDKQFDDFYALGQKMAEAYLTGGRESGNVIMKDFDKIASDMSDAMESINNGYQNSFSGAISNLTDTLAADKVLMSIVLAVGLAFLLISSFLIVNKVVPALFSLDKAMREIKDGDGDLSRRIKINTRDEIGAVTSSFNSLMDDIQKIIRETKNSFNTLRDTASEVTANAQQTAAAASENAATVSEIASTMDHVSQNAQEVAILSERTAKEAEQGSQGVDEIARQMKVIVSTSAETSQVIESLTATLNQVNQIVELITHIAEQTNLLALNAAIEAARAGDQGRGFAVVADEVRKLAEQSAGAAKEINQLIAAVQVQSNKAVEAISEGNKQVREGTLVVEEVGNRFKVIMRSIEGLADQIQNVATASEQVSGGIQNIASTTEEQTATMEEVSALTEKLSQMSLDVYQLVGKFKA